MVSQKLKNIISFCPLFRADNLWNDFLYISLLDIFQKLVLKNSLILNSSNWFLQLFTFKES